MNNPQIVAGHVVGLLEAQHPENSGGYVLQRAIGTKTDPLGILAYHNKRYRVGGMGSVGTTRYRVDHHLRVAMIGSHQHSASTPAHGIVNFSQTGIDSFNSLDGGRNLT